MKSNQRELQMIGDISAAATTTDYRSQSIQHQMRMTPGWHQQFSNMDSTGKKQKQNSLISSSNVNYMEDYELNPLLQHQNNFLNQDLTQDSTRLDHLIRVTRDNNQYRSHTSHQEQPPSSSQYQSPSIFMNLRSVVTTSHGTKRQPHKQILDKFLTSQQTRLDSAKLQMKRRLQNNSDIQHQKVGWNESRVEEEISLLKRARQVAKESYHNRIRYGGSLVKQVNKPKNQSDMRPRSEIEGIVGGYSVEEQVEEPLMHRYFKHKEQTMRSSVTRTVPKSNEMGGNSLRSKKMYSMKQSSQIQTERHSSLIKRRPQNRLASMNKEEAKLLRAEEIKSMIYCLPIILAEDNKMFIKGCNLLHKNQYSEAHKLFEEGLVKSNNEDEQELFTFNLAYCLFKLGNSNDAKKLWSCDIATDHQKLLASFNLAILSYLDDNSSFNESFKHLDFINQKLNLYLNSLILPQVSLQPKLEIPIWFNLDQLFINTRKLVNKFKSRIIKEGLNDDQCVKSVMNKFYSLNQRFQRHKEGQRASSTTRNAINVEVTNRQHKQQSSISNYPGKSTMRSRIREILPEEMSKEDNFETALDEYQASQLMAGSIIESDLNKRFLKDNTPILIRAYKEMEQLDEIIPTKFSKNQNYQTEFISDATTEESLPIPFVESKRPEVIIRKHKKNKKANYFTQSQIVTEALKPLPTPEKEKVFDVEKTQDNQQIEIIHLEEQGILETPPKIQINSTKAYSVQFSGLPTPQNKGQINQSSQKSTLRQIAGEFEIQQPSPIIELRNSQIEPHINTSMPQSSRFLQSLIPTSNLNQSTNDWIRPSLIASSKKTSIVSSLKYSMPHSVRELQILDRPPQTSDFVQFDQKPQINTLDSKYHQRSSSQPPVLTSYHSRSRLVSGGASTPGINNLTTFRPMSAAAAAVSQCSEYTEILSEFKGPLINKEGQLYVDEEYDKTYKKRLRLKEIDLIQEYIIHIQQKVENKLEDTITSSSKGIGMMLQYNNDQKQHNNNKNVTYETIDKLISKLKFFIKYPQVLRQELIKSCKPDQFKIYQTGETIFRQNDDSTQTLYVILRGSVKAILTKLEFGMIPIEVSTFYDGREFGESALYEVSDKLTSEMVEEMNRQKYTCEAMEPTYVLVFDKPLTISIINAGLQDVFEKRITFLSQIDLFRDFDMHVLLPLANNMETCSFKLGEFILREGQAPKGLFLITKGSVRVGSEQLNMRSKDIFPQGRLRHQLKPLRFKGNFHDMEKRLRIFEDDGRQLEKNLRQCDTRDSDGEDELDNHSPQLERQRIYQDNRVFQNERIKYDENGQRIKDQIVYRDFMTFFELTAKDYFGGSVLLLNNRNREEIQPQSRRSSVRSATGNRRQQDDFGTLSVIADSAEVELLMMDRSQMSFFPDDVQKQIYSRLEKAFHPDNPYSTEVIERIKDKFHEWASYKLEKVGGLLRHQYYERHKNKLSNVQR